MESLEDRYFQVVRDSTMKGSGCGCYQIFALIVIKLGIISAGFFIYGLTYWQMVPT
jgi:hypothetical protein